MATESTQTGALIAPRDNLSYVRGATDIPLSDATVSRHLLETVSRFPERPAVIFREQGIRWTWREFASEVDVLATALLNLGIEPGDRVGIWSPNRAEWLLTQFATARMGAVLVNINPAYRLAELEYALNKVGCKAIVAAEQFKASKYLEMLQTLAPELADAEPNALHAAKLPDLRAVIRMGDAPSSGMLNFDALMQANRGRVDRAKLDALEAAFAADQPINIQFTSGTTGNPKGATLTHRNIVNNARYIAMAMRLSEQDSLCIPVPLYHCFGMVLAVLACVSTG
jgi:fatty-acyl-CoA synthase